MLKTGLSHGVAIVPNAPKQRYNCPDTGAHFEFSEMCTRLEKLERLRFLEESRSKKKTIHKDFIKKSQIIHANQQPLDGAAFGEKIAQEAQPSTIIAKAHIIKAKLEQHENLHMSEKRKTEQVFETAKLDRFKQSER